MSEIVFTETHEQNRDRVATMDYGRQPLDRKVTLFQSRDKVSLVTSTMIVGVPGKHKDKRYYYWRSIESFGFRRNSAGTVVPYQCQRPWDAKVGVGWGYRQPRSPFQMLTERDDWELANEYRRAVWSSFGVEHITDLYPLMNDYGLIHYHTIPNSLTMGFRQDSVATMAAYAFGQKRFTKRLVQAVKNTDPYIVAYAQQFRGLVPDEAVVSFMERNHFDEEMEETFQPHSPTIRPFLLTANKATRDNLISVTLDNAELRRVRLFVRLGAKYMKAHADRGETTYKNWTQLAR